MNLIDKDIIKQTHITTIHLLEKKLDKDRSEFRTLWRMSPKELEKVRDDLIVNYNDMIEGYEFAAAMFSRGDKI